MQNEVSNQFDRLAVIAACKALMKAVEAQRVEKREEAIAKLCQPHKRFGMFGHEVVRTRDQAIHLLQHDCPYFPTWDSVSNYRSHAYDSALSILRTCNRMVGAIVWLSLESIDLLSAYLPHSSDKPTPAAP